MPDIHDVATLTSKGQITLPKPIRQALGIDAGSKVAFDLDKDGRGTVSRADGGHKDPAIMAFLALLAGDIQSGRNVRGLPDDLARAMLEQLEPTVSLDEEIDGDVVI